MEYLTEVVNIDSIELIPFDEIQSIKQHVNFKFKAFNN